MDKALKGLPAPKVLVKYIDDLLLICPPDLADVILKRLNTINRDLKFTIEEERDSRIAYLDFQIIRTSPISFETIWYQKPKSSGRILNWTSKHSDMIIRNTGIAYVKQMKAVTAPILSLNEATVFHTHSKTNTFTHLFILDFHDFPSPLSTYSVAIPTSEDSLAKFCEALKRDVSSQTRIKLLENISIFFAERSNLHVRWELLKALLANLIDIYVNENVDKNDREMANTTIVKILQNSSQTESVVALTELICETTRSPAFQQFANNCVHKFTNLLKKNAFNANNKMQYGQVLNTIHQFMEKFCGDESMRYQISMIQVLIKAIIERSRAEIERELESLPANSVLYLYLAKHLKQ